MQNVLKEPCNFMEISNKSLSEEEVYTILYSEISSNFASRCLVILFCHWQKPSVPEGDDISLAQLLNHFERPKANP